MHTPKKNLSQNTGSTECKIDRREVSSKNTTTILDLIKNIDTESVDCMLLAVYKNCVISSNMYLYSRPAL